MTCLHQIVCAKILNLIELPQSLSLKLYLRLLTKEMKRNVNRRVCLVKMKK